YTDSGHSGAHGVRNLYEEAYQMATHIPGVCLSGAAVNDFQRTQCDKFWVEAIKQATYTVAPLVPVLLFFLFGFEALGATYRRARRKLEKGAADFPAIVTNPARMSNDFYSWMFCLNCVSVQLNEKTQIRVYLAPEDAIPLPGQTMAVFILGNQFGKRRFIGRTYTPHVAVK
ncbi:MAG: hypothetical protein ACXVCH_17945, partial [Bdellovibrionota bacterium]